MSSHCKECDPKHFNIHGFCKSCKRKCLCPLYDPRSNMTPEDYEAYKKNWDAQWSDLLIESMRRKDT